MIKRIVSYVFEHLLHAYILLLAIWLLPTRGNTQPINNMQLASNTPVSTVFNYEVDIKGDPDPLIPGTEAGFIDSKFLAINVPPGMKLHITHVTGDVVAWITGIPAPNSKAGILWGLKPNLPDQSMYWTTPGASEVTFVYVQGTVSERNDAIRIPIDQKVDTYLCDDHVLISRLSAWMNTTGQPIHMEATFKLTFELVPIDLSTPRRRSPSYMLIWSPWWWRL